MISIIYITFMVGLALIVVAVIGGGLEIKEFKIPPLPLIPRALSFLLGSILIAVCLFDSSILTNIGPAPPPSPKPPTQSILLAYAQDQKEVATELDSYLSRKGYVIRPIMDDFSGIKPEDHERSGTIRLVYRPSVETAADNLGDDISSHFPSKRLVKSENINASVDLQIQLW